MIAHVRKSVLLEQGNHGGVGFLEFPQLLIGEAQGVDDLLLLALVVGVDRFLEMVANADIVHHEALVLGFAAHAVHTGDGLQQVMGNHDLVQIHHLLDRRIEAGKQHVVDNEDPQVAVDTVFFTAERQFEALDARLVP